MEPAWPPPQLQRRLRGDPGSCLALCSQHLWFSTIHAQLTQAKKKRRKKNKEGKEDEKGGRKKRFQLHAWIGWLGNWGKRRASTGRAWDPVDRSKRERSMKRGGKEGAPSQCWVIQLVWLHGLSIPVLSAASLTVGTKASLSKGKLN